MANSHSFSLQSMLCRPVQPLPPDPFLPPSTDPPPTPSPTPPAPSQFEIPNGGFGGASGEGRSQQECICIQVCATAGAFFAIAHHLFTNSQPASYKLTVTLLSCNCWFLLYCNCAPLVHKHPSLCCQRSLPVPCPSRISCHEVICP